MRRFILPPLIPLLLCAASASAQVLFQENFNLIPDWVVPQNAVSEVNCIVGQTCTYPVPGNFYDYRTAATEACSNLDGNHHTLNINGLNPRGGAGKSFMMWSEPCPSRSGSWGSDGLLGIAFPPQSEIYVRWWAKFSPTWVWNTGSPMQKFLHMSHYDSSDPSTTWNFSLGVQNKPRWAGQFAVYNGSDGRGEWAPQTSPLTAARDSSLSWTDGPNYSMQPGGPGYNGTVLWSGGIPSPWTQPGVPGDGEWHQYQIHLKLNTPGVADGMAGMWYDGVQIQNRVNITWIPAGDDPALWRWNHAWIGGNNSNYFTPAEEQFYAVDDVVVSTTFVPLDYEIVDGVPIDTIAPTTTAIPAAGPYTTPQTVTLTANDPAATIYYTLDGSTPTTSSAVYSDPLVISTTTTVKFFSRDAANNNETVQTAVYTITQVPVGTGAPGASARFSAVLR